MPRPPAVAHDHLKAAILNAEGVIDTNGKIPGPCSSVWTQISESLGFLVKPSYVYQYVKENRHNSYTELKRYNKISSPEPRTLVSNGSESNGSTDKSSISSDAQVEQIFPQKSFNVIIPESEWENFKPIDTQYKRKDRSESRQYKILPQLRWTQALSKYLWEQHKLPCPYTFKRATVYKDRFLGYIRIAAECKECGAIARGRVIEEPAPGSDVQLQWLANDTRKIPHTRKRSLIGDVRKDVGGIHLKNVSAAVYRRVTAKKIMDQGDVEPPILYTCNVLRKAKQTQRDAALGVVEGAHPVMNLAIMKHAEPYAGSIHDVALDKTIVHYSTPAQMLLYKHFCKEKYSILSLDATGSLVKKIERLNHLSGHIFLYELVMNTGEFQLPVVQMLSEKQDANTILYWLNEWERKGAPCPKEVNVDNSPALKSAVVRSFGRSVDINDYLRKRFLALSGKGNELPPCYLRLDVAHFILSAKKWKLWRNKERSRLKDFYLRCLGLLIKSKSLIAFQEVLRDVLVMASASHEGLPMQSTVESSFDKLSTKIKGDESNIHQGEEEDVLFSEQHTSSESEEDSEEEITVNNCITIWLDEIYKDVNQKISSREGRLNPYYCPDVAEEIKRLAKEFPLWSAVMVTLYNSPKITASSAPVESDFADLKNRILQGSAKPIRIDRFVALHLESIEGYCKIAGAPRKAKMSQEKPQVTSKNQVQIPPTRKREPDPDPSLQPTLKKLHLETENDEESYRDCVLTKFSCNEESKFFNITQTCSEQPNEAPYDLNFMENWRGLAKRGIRMQSKYLSPSPHFDVAVKANRLARVSSGREKSGSREFV